VDEGRAEALYELEIAFAEIARLTQGAGTAKPWVTDRALRHLPLLFKPHPWHGIPIGDDAPRIPTIGAVALPGASNASLLVQFDLAGIAVSAGSACASGAMKGSEVLAAMGVAPEIAAGTLRISFGPSTSDTDVDRFLTEWSRIAQRAKAA